MGWAIVSGAAGAFQVLLERGASIREAHRSDADAGAQGNLRQFNRERPIEKWVQIRDALQQA
ncbi:MAG: hypothetical protein OEO79_11220 [Gemmatimonadota bacterium]|nr:hypothetical protein [Gemmatimonadota bacterium]MDH3422731.1 hypothetical protein [Gemmatimonadota bacterium]